jgi:hypothetical protein
METIKMKRIFGEEDRKKKQTRISLGASAQSPVDGSSFGRLEAAIKESLKDGFLPCPTAFSIAKGLSMPINWVGDTADRINIRIVDCQLGCFKIEKAAKTAPGSKAANPLIVQQIEAVLEKSAFTCSSAFDIARRMNVRPIDVADAANLIDSKIHDCQLGCF